MKQNGQRVSAQTELQAILLAEPQNQAALTLMAELNQANSIAALWLDLGDKQQNGLFRYSADQNLEVDGRFINGLDYVSGLLSGFSFEIVSAEDKFMAGDKSEEATIRCTTPGWLYGTQFVVQRYIANQLDKADGLSDGTFTAGGSDGQ